MTEEEFNTNIDIGNFELQKAGKTYFSFCLIIQVKKDLIIPFKSYLSLFTKYCLIIKKFNVDFEVYENDDSLKLEFGYGVENDLKIEEVENHFTDFVKLVKVKNLYLCLKRRTKSINDTTLFHKFCMRLEEEIRHLNRVIYLEIGLKRILEIPERSSANMKIDDEIIEIKKTSKEQYDDYKQFVKYIETKKDNEHLLKENSRLSKELEKVDKERKRILDELLKVIHHKFDNVEKVVKDKIDIINIKKLIVNNQMDEVFDLLSLIQDSNINNEILLLHRRWNENELNRRHDFANTDTYITEKQRIINGILEILKNYK